MHASSSIMLGNSLGNSGTISRFLQLVPLLVCVCQASQKEFELYGLGASLPGEVYEAWAPAFENYRNRFVDLNNEYAATGSGVGKATITGRFSNPEASYIGTDSVLTEQDHAEHPDLQMVPILGA